MENVNIMDREVLQTLMICYLYASLNMTYEEISDYMGISIATVGRRISAGKKAKWLEERLIFKHPKEFDDISDYIYSNALLGKRICRRFPGQVDRITIVPSGPDLPTTQCHAAFATARLLEETLVGNHILGVNWGSTSFAVANALAPPKLNHNLTCVPVFGNLGLPSGRRARERSLSYESSGVAYLIAQKFGAPEPVPLSFQAFIPPQFAGKDPDEKIIMRYIENDSSYQEIFDKEGLINKIDTLVTSIGSLDTDSAWFRFEEFHNMNPDPEFRKLKQAGVVGDIGQHFVTEKGFVPNPPKSIADINKRVIGLQLKEHLVGLVERHRKEPQKGAGLMIVTVGKKKAQITIAAIRTGVNHLIIDEDLAKEVLRLLGDEQDETTDQ